MKYYLILLLITGCASCKSTEIDELKAQCLTELLKNNDYVAEIKGICGKSRMCLKEKIHLYEDACVEKKQEEINKKR